MKKKQTFFSFKNTLKLILSILYATFLLIWTTRIIIPWPIANTYPIDWLIMLSSFSTYFLPVLLVFPRRIYYVSILCLIILVPWIAITGYFYWERMATAYAGEVLIYLLLLITTFLLCVGQVIFRKGLNHGRK